MNFTAQSLYYSFWAWPLIAPPIITLLNSLPLIRCSQCNHRWRNGSYRLLLNYVCSCNHVTGTKQTRASDYLQAEVEKWKMITCLKISTRQCVSLLPLWVLRGKHVNLVKLHGWAMGPCSITQHCRVGVFLSFKTNHNHLRSYPRIFMHRTFFATIALKKCIF